MIMTGKHRPTENPADEPASELLKQIEREKARLVKEGKIKKPKETSTIFRRDGHFVERKGKIEQIIDDELPFDIPDTWEWVRLETITYSVGGKDNQIKESEVKKEGPYPAISQGQEFIEGYSYEENKVITDLPLVMFGDHTLVVKYVDFPFVICADGTKFHKCILVSPKYLYYLLSCVAGKIGSHGYSRHYKFLKATFLPLPPLAEQERIVEKLDVFMSLEKELRAEADLRHQQLEHYRDSLITGGE